MRGPALNLDAYTTRQLLMLYARILDVLLDLNVIRSRNAPAGDYAELLVAELYRGELAKKSVKSYDVIAGNRKIQVEALVIDRASKRLHSFSPFRSWDFDACVFVVFDAATYEVIRGLAVSRKGVEAMSHKVARVAGHRVSVRQVAASSSAEDHTERLRAIQLDMEKKRTS